VAGLLTLFFLCRERVAEDWQGYVRTTVIVLIAAAGLLGAAILIPFRWPRWRGTFAGAVAALAVVELFVYQDIPRLKHYDVYRNPPAHVRFLRENLGGYRTFSFPSTTLAPNTTSAFRIRNINSMLNTHTFDYKWFYERFIVPETGHLLGLSSRNMGKLQRTEDRALDLLGVKYLVTDRKYLDPDDPDGRIVMDRFGSDYPVVFESDSVAVLENTDVFPMSAVYKVFHIDGNPHPAAVKAFAAEPKGITILDRAPMLGSESIAALVGKEPAPVEDQFITFNTARFRIDDPDGGVLVWRETFYRGWKARLDGEETPILCADGLFQAVAVPPGRHEILFRYTPAGLPTGLVLSLLAGLAVLTVVAGHGIRWRLKPAA
jgi:hypothetical protein